MASELKNSFGIRDNHSCGKVADFLVEKITAGSHLSVVSAYFTIYAYEALSAELDQIAQLHFLFTAYLNSLYLAIRPHRCGRVVRAGLVGAGAR